MNRMIAPNINIETARGFQKMPQDHILTKLRVAFLTTVVAREAQIAQDVLVDR